MDVPNTTAARFTGPALKRQPESPEEAARQFEEVLVRQFVETMTDGLFDSKIDGEDAPGWMGAYGDMQKDTLSDVLTKHLVDSGSLRLRDLLLRQWQGGDDAAPGTPARSGRT